MSHEFDELVGPDVPPEERARLRYAHDLLLEAGPMPELPPALAEPFKPPDADVIPFVPKRRYVAASVAAAAVVIATAFGAGYLAGHHGANGGFVAAHKVRMEPTARAQNALASLKVAKTDGDGNSQMVLEVSGLHKLRPGAYYELWLTKNGTPKARCGGFRASEPKKSVTLSVSYTLTNFDGWVVTQQDPGQRKPGPVLFRT